MEHLDAILGFLAVILVASVVVTAATQVLISLLGLRGTNLRRALADLFESACQDSDAKRYSRVIARRVLQQPLVSGSVFSRAGLRLQELPFLPADAAGKLRWAGSGIPMQPWLLGAACGFIGWPAFLWMVDRLFSWDLCAYADFVARYVPILNLCEHPWRSGAILGAILGGLLSRSRMATSIRLDELVDVLEKLSAPAGGTLPDPAQRAMLVVAGDTRSRLRPKTSTTPSQAERIFPGADEEEGGVAVAVERPITQAAAHAEGRADGLTFWFDRAMERASQRFTMQARIVTVILSALLVFGGHFDAIRLFDSLSADAQTRAELAASAEAMTRLAEQTPRGREAAAFQSVKEGGRSVVPEVYRTAMVAALALPPAPSEPPKTKPRRGSRSVAGPAADAQSGEEKAALDAKARASKALEAKVGFASREDAVLWLRETLEGDAALEPLVTAYEHEVDAQLPSDADKLVDHSASIRAGLLRSKLQLVPETSRGWAPVGNELPGLLVSVAFLSLGAALCFNLLKRIASLRPLPGVK